MSRSVCSAARVAVSAVLVFSLVPVPALAKGLSDSSLVPEVAEAQAGEAAEVTSTNELDASVDGSDAVALDPDATPADANPDTVADGSDSSEEASSPQVVDAVDENDDADPLSILEEELATSASTAKDNKLTLGTTQSGSITSSRTTQRWRFTLTSSGRVTIKAKSNINQWVNINLYDSDGNQLIMEQTCFYRSSTGSGNYSDYYDLNKGSYTLSFSKGSGTGSYSFTTSFSSANETFTENGNGTNNSMDKASALTFGRKINGLIARNDSKDFYRFSLSKSSSVKFKGTSHIGSSAGTTAYVYLYDSNGNKLQEKYFVNDSVTGRCDFKYAFSLKAGTYYFVVADNGTSSRLCQTGAYNFTATLNASSASRVTMYRLYNKYTGEHLYTSSSDERDALARVGWVSEGTAWIAPSKSSTPVYRLYNPYVAGGDHHYTTSKAEYDSLQSRGWKDEGVAWYSDEAKGVPLYRQYNPYSITGTHNYTSSKAENDSLVNLGWKAEGIAWYGVK